MILYGVVSMTNIKHMFVGGILPGAFMILSIAAIGVWRARRDRVPRTAFDPREALPALWNALGEILLPVLILVLFLKGITTLVETGAVAVIYAIVLEVVVHRDLKLRQLPGCLPEERRDPRRDPRDPGHGERLLLLHRGRADPRGSSRSGCARTWSHPTCSCSC